MTNFITLYVFNVESIYRCVESLAVTVAKRVIKNKPVTVEYLAGCSSVKKIISLACKEVNRFEGYKPNKEERREAANHLADYILTDCVPYEIKELTK